MALSPAYHQPGQEKQTACCSLSLLKACQYAVVSLLLLLSLLLLCLGLLLLLPPSPAPLPPGLACLLSSLLLLCCCSLGCWATRGEQGTALSIYSGLLATAIVLQVCVGVTGYLHRGWAHSQVVTSINRVITTEYGADNSTLATQALDQLQESLHCCGADSFSDWQQSSWGQGRREKVPPSCCKSPSPACGVRDHPSNIHYTGCAHSISQTLSKRLLLVMCVAGLLVAVQGAGVVLALRLRSQLRALG